MLIILRKAIKAMEAAKVLKSLFKDNLEAGTIGGIEYEKHHMKTLYNSLKDIGVNIFPGGLKELNDQLMSGRQIIIPIEEKTLSTDKYRTYSVFLFIEIAASPRQVCSCNKDNERKILLRVEYKSKFKII